MVWTGSKCENKFHHHLTSCYNLAYTHGKKHQGSRDCGSCMQFELIIFI
jgi:hypothetical protein